MISKIKCRTCGDEQEFKSICSSCGYRLVELKSYDYRCDACHVTWDEVVDYDDRDDVCCRSCGEKATRLLTISRVLRNKQLLNSKEKGWSKDLKEANDLEKSMAYGNLSRSGYDDKIRVTKEIKKLKET
jgi:putative FmdB family regulatory protein